jgi:hypothetical protein
LELIIIAVPYQSGTGIDMSATITSSWAPVAPGGRTKVSADRTKIPERVDVEAVRDLCKRRREARMTGVWLSIEDVESMLIEVELYRAKFDASSRRQRDAARVTQRRKPSGSEVMAKLAKEDPAPERI